MNASRVHNRALREALDALLAGKPVSRTETKAFGGAMKRVRKAS